MDNSRLAACRLELADPGLKPDSNCLPVHQGLDLYPGPGSSGLVISNLVIGPLDHCIQVGVKSLAFSDHEKTVHPLKDIPNPI